MVCVHACLEMDVPYHVPLHTVAKVTKWALYRINHKPTGLSLSFILGLFKLRI